MASPVKTRSGQILSAIQFATELYRASNFSSQTPPMHGARRPALMNDALDGNGGGFTAADAECRDAASQILRFERMQQRNDQACAGGADRMAERAGAAIDVELVSGNAEI